MMDEKQIKNAANNVSNFLEDAVGDMASDMCSSSSGFLDDKWSKHIKKLKKNGCGDIMGALADDLYNDPDTLQDLMGDRIHDEVKGNDEDYLKVLDEMDKRSFPAKKKAIQALRDSQIKYLEVKNKKGK
jgi:hypothetical protein